MKPLPKNIFKQIDDINKSIQDRVVYICKFLAVEMLGLTEEQFKAEEDWVRAEYLLYEFKSNDGADYLYVETMVNSFRIYIPDANMFDELLSTTNTDFCCEVPKNWLFENFEKQVIKERDIYRKRTNKIAKKQQDLLASAKAKLEKAGLSKEEKKLVGLKD